MLRGMAAWVYISSIASDFYVGLSTWRGPHAARARRVRLVVIDIFLVVLAGTLPWSTTAVAILTINCFILILLSAQLPRLQSSFTRCACVLPVALFLIALIGTLWAIDIPYADRIRSVEHVGKLLLLPLLFYHFQESDRAKWIFTAFIFSNVILLVYSFIVYFDPNLTLRTKLPEVGIPIKNYIDQSQAFALCAVALVGISIEVLLRKRYAQAAIAITLAAIFLTNLAFINVARTAFLYLPVMFLLLLNRYLSGIKLAMAIVCVAILSLGLWASSSNLQRKVSRIFTEYDQFNNKLNENEPLSVAMRLEYWRKSIDFIRSAPLWGHGTGATRVLFERDAADQAGLAALVTSNPHNQTFAVAIQWGLVGCIVLYAMWVSHLLLFRGPDFAALVGLLVVAQNIVSSLVNSHLFDFYQGWLYVLTVGIAGGTLRRTRGDTEPSHLSSRKNA